MHALKRDTDRRTSLNVWFVPLQCVQVEEKEVVGGVHLAVVAAEHRHASWHRGERANRVHTRGSETSVDEKEDDNQA